MSEEAQKKKRGHPPWTEEQKAARRELNAKKREERAIEERRQETAYQQRKRVKKGKRYREGQAGPWSPEMRASNKKAWDDKFAERDKEYKQLIAENPHKTKAELGIPDHWKPRDGSSDGYYGVALRQSRTSLNLPIINIKNPHEVEQRIDEYFDFCEVNNRPPNMVGLGNWLGVGYKTILTWKNGNWDVDTVGEVVQRALSVIEESLVTQVQDNPKAMVGGMFLLKSMFHYKEQQDIVITTGAQNEELSADEIAKRYLGDGKTVETTFADEEGGE